MQGFSRRCRGLHEDSYPLNFEHVLKMTTRVGMLQHSKLSVPDPGYGYTTDDNARALLVATRYAHRKAGHQALFAASVYVDFLQRAQKANGWFRNFTDEHGSFIDEEGSDDCFGRAIWACALAMRSRASARIVRKAERILRRALPALDRLVHLRGMAYSMLGLQALTQLSGYSELSKRYLRLFGGRFVEAFSKHSGPRWRWFEERLTYANALLPAGLAAAAQALGERTYAEVAKSAMQFLASSTWRRDHFKLVGNEGWYAKGGPFAEYDEQPVDAGYLALASVSLFHALKDRAYIDMAEHALAWFYGRNSKGAWLYEPNTGGCYDGLTRTGVNLNQGAESILALHIAALSFEDGRDALKKGLVAVM